MKEHMQFFIRLSSLKIARLSTFIFSNNKIMEQL